MAAPRRRLAAVLNGLTPAPPPVGTLTLGDIAYEVPPSLSPARLPHTAALLDAAHPATAEHLRFLVQKHLLAQDVFLLSQPGPYARRLALTFARLINAEYEYIALHRDVGETELKQGREIREGGNLVYADSAAVRAVKHGRILILEGIERAERGIMPVLNNLLENREMNLDDGTHIIHAHRYAMLESDDTGSNNAIPGKVFIPAHKNFRVIAIAAPVPPYPGYPLDPPFRSRFQCRFLENINALFALATAPTSESAVTQNTLSSSLVEKLRDIFLATQYASDARHALESVSTFMLPPFPQTALKKLHDLASVFPPPPELSPLQLSRLFLALHPALTHAPPEAWTILNRQVEEAGLGRLESTITDAADDDSISFFGYTVSHITRMDAQSATVVFSAPPGMPPVSRVVPAGPRALLPLPLPAKPGFRATRRFMGLLTCMLQAHALGWDISLVPPALSAASSSTTTLVVVLGEILGYETETVQLYKELGGRELIMRRRILDGGATTWEPSPVVEGAWKGRLVHLAGLDVIGPTTNAISRLLQDREVELWDGKRIVADASEEEMRSGELSIAHPSFRVISTASKSLPLKDWVSDEHANIFMTIPSQPMSSKEEEDILLQTACPLPTVKTLLSFAARYRQSLSVEAVQKRRSLGTRSLVRMAQRIARFPGDEDLYGLLCRSLLADFLPATERMNLETLLHESGLQKQNSFFHPSPEVQDGRLVFPAATAAPGDKDATFVPLFEASRDPEGVSSHVPHMDHFYDNSLQTGLMRDLAIDMEILGEHLVLLGNQGVGKNKIVDRLCQMLGRPREYIQLHRDTTVNQLMFTTSLEGGIIRHTDSPLFRAILHGRVIIIDEADKAPEHVVAIFRGLAAQNEMSLSDGRRVRRVRERPSDIPVHPDFRLVLLANRPGYPFLGNHFLQVLGDSFSCHSVSNPDLESEIKLLSQLAPELDEDILRRLVATFQDLRIGYEAGTLSYPYSLRELINLVRHMKAYPSDPLESALRNIFDFDVYKHDTIDKLAEILDKHGLDVQYLGIHAAREASKKRIVDIEFKPEGSTDLKEPKEGNHDPDNDPHEGGNTWAGGTGGRDTAGLGGRGGYKRLFKGHNIKQVPDELKSQVLGHIKEKAREMARQELMRRLKDLNMTAADAKGYSALLTAVQAHISSLHDLLEHLAAKEEERVWVKRQTDGELDDSRLTEGLTGEATVYKRRGMEKPELGRPQMKPKRIRFVFDISGSMYRFQYDGRLQRSLETAVMLMETFDRLSRKEKYAWDIYGHSGDGPVIPLVEMDNPPSEIRDRWKVAEKMNMVTQYAFQGDFTVEAIEKAVDEVAKFDADDWFVIAITDANFGRYQITPEHLKKAMDKNPKVHSALICIGEGAEVSWIPKALPGRGFRIANTADIPNVLRSILSSMVER